MLCVVQPIVVTQVVGEWACVFYVEIVLFNMQKPITSAWRGSGRCRYFEAANYGCYKDECYQGPDKGESMVGD